MSTSGILNLYMLAAALQRFALSNVRKANMPSIKFFVNSNSERSQRYFAISQSLSALSLPYTVDFQFQKDGINIRGNNYPIVKMQFVDGTLLHKYLETNLGNRDRLRELADSWMEMSAVLRRANVAHGDLQHRNVFVTDGKLKLIDYDGMYVPQLSELQSAELGLPSFQHPGRDTRHFGPYLDNFSDLVMYTSITALSSDSSLWSHVSIENQRLLFSQDDFLNPERSELLVKLKNSTDAEVNFLANRLEAMLKQDVRDIPNLHNLVGSTSCQSSHTATILDPFGYVIEKPFEQAVDYSSVTQSSTKPEPKRMQASHMVSSAGNQQTFLQSQISYPRSLGERLADCFHSALGLVVLIVLHGRRDENDHLAKAIWIGFVAAHMLGHIYYSVSVELDLSSSLPVCL